MHVEGVMMRWRIVIIGILALLFAVTVFLLVHRRREHIAAIAARRSCQNDRWLIQSAKDQLAAELDMTNGTQITSQQLMPYLPAVWKTNWVTPGNCPAGGAFALGPIGVYPRCTVHGEIE